LYLGGVISEDLSCDKDVARRISLAAGIVRDLHKVWKAINISKSTKALLYQTLVQTILDNSETWIFKEEQKSFCDVSVEKGATRRDRRRNLDHGTLKELDIHGK